MPLPKREKGEEAQKFMGRCMTSEVMGKEYPDQKQRVAICMQQSRAGANKSNLSEMVQEELVYAEYLNDDGEVEELTEANFVVPDEEDYEDFGEETEEIDAASLWDNIRKKKEREGKNYKPARPGDKDRPQKDAWDRAKGSDVEQIKVGDYQTKHFDMCPSAVALYSKILKKEGVDMGLVARSVKLQDGLFGIEKVAKARKAASEQDLQKVKRFASSVMSIAKELGMTEEHSYIQDHIDVVQSLVKKGSSEALQYGKPKKNDPRKTPAKPSERKKGSKKNKPKSASKPNKSIKFSKNTTSRLSKMVTEHNKKGKGSRAGLGALKAVYRRGAGAFSTSHAPKMSRDGWAMARVRAFLYLLRNGRPSNPNYKQDNDLLPKGHPRSSKAEFEGADAAKYQGRTVTLNKPFLTPGGPKKRSVYVKNEKGNVVKVNFGDPNMRIKKSNPERRRNFRSRHNCDNPGPKWKARYWSCKAW